MKRNAPLFCTLILGLCCNAGLHAVDLTAEARLASAYVKRGLLQADLNAQPSIELGMGDFYAGAWAALALENEGEPDSFGDEYQVYFGSGWALGDKLGLDAGAKVYRHPSEVETWEGYVGLFAELGTLSPAIYIYNDFDLDQLTAEASLRFALPLQGFPGEVATRLGYVEGQVDYRYLELDLIYPLELGPGRVDLGLHYSGNDYGLGVADDQVFASAAIRIDF